jgi:phage baseplate assembly protein W
MATVTTTITTKKFKDLDLNFNIHPVKKDINRHYDEMAIINSVKNLVLTNHYERLFQPDLGSNVRRFLFENIDIITATAIEREITLVVQNYEPRVRLARTTVVPDFDNNGFSVTMEFFIINKTESVSINFLLERIR